MNEIRSFTRKYLGIGCQPHECSALCVSGPGDLDSPE